MVKKTDEELVLNITAKKALDNILQDMMIFVNAIKVNDNIQKLNANLIRDLELIAEQCLEMRAKLERGLKINPHDLAKFVNELNRANDKLHTYKFEDKNVKMLRNLGHALPGAKKIDELPAQKAMSELQNNIKVIVERIQKNADTIVRNAEPEHRSLWKRFTSACIKFAKTCKEKILSIFGKHKKEEATPKSKDFKEAHMEEIKADPVKRQGAMVAAAAAAKAKRAADLKADKERNDIISPKPPERPARPPRKV